MSNCILCQVYQQYCMCNKSETYQPIPSGKTPHKCPVCEGMGKLNDEYCTPNSQGQSKVVNCHACKGEGVVWG